jgi:chromosome segregation ATPase
MFGTKVVSELAETMKQYLTQRHQNTGGKKKTSQQQEELEAKIKERDALNEQIAKKQSDLQKLESDQDEKERERSQLQEDLARMGGAGNGKQSKSKRLTSARKRSTLIPEKLSAKL